MWKVIRLKFRTLWNDLWHVQCNASYDHAVGHWVRQWETARNQVDAYAKSLTEVTQQRDEMARHLDKALVETIMRKYGDY